MTKSLAEKLRAAVESLHGCSAVFRSSEEVTETFRGEVAWRREVATFDLQGHPKATTAYAWVEAIPGSTGRTYAVLAYPPVASPLDAVRASIAQTIQQQRH